MSKMGRAYQWVRENGLQNDPNALNKYIVHLEEKKKETNVEADTGKKSHPDNPKCI